MHTLPAVACVILFGACNAGQTGKHDNGIDSDSIAAMQRIEPLPVKQLASVENVVYDVTVFDTLHDGTIDDLRDLYDGKDGWFTFRGGLLRDANYGGTVKGRPTKVVQDWMFKTDYDGTKTKLGTWGGGTGWTGQPVYVKWKQGNGVKEEIIVGSLCCKVYRIDYKTGMANGEPIDVTNPIKGSVSLDPTLNGNLYVGQGVPKVPPVSQMCINLNENKITYLSGQDRDAWHGWGACDSSPVRVGQFLFWPRENGTIYKYLIEGDHIVKHTTLRIRAKDDGAAGMENSICIYRNYGFFGNNHGDIFCIDLNTMKPIWHYDNVDDIDASIVCEVVDGVPYLYCGCEVDRQGDTGMCHFVKLNGLTGQPVWENQYPCKKLNSGEKHFDGGLYGTPLLGRGNCKDMLFFNLCQYETTGQADLMAIDRRTGKTIYRKRLKRFAWSSMVGFLNEKGEQYIFAGDSSGNAYLVEGATGEIIFTERMVNNFESSPVVIGNNLVVGSRGQEIYKFHIE